MNNPLRVPEPEVHWSLGEKQTFVCVSRGKLAPGPQAVPHFRPPACRSAEAHAGNGDSTRVQIWNSRDSVTLSYLPALESDNNEQLGEM